MTFSRWQRVRSSIVTRLVLIGLIIILIGVVTRYFVLAQLLRDDLTDVVAAQQTALATYVARDIDQKVQERQNFLNQMAYALPSELLPHPLALRDWLGERYRLQPLFSAGMFVTDTTGRVVTDFPAAPSRVGLNYSDRDYIQQALRGQAYVGRAVIGKVAQEPVLPMAVPLLDDEGRVTGVLAGVTTLSAPGFLNALQQGRIGATGGFLLVSPRDKMFVSASDPAFILRPTPPEGANLLHDRAMQGYRGTGITTNARGIEELSAMVSVPSTGWFVVARLPTVEAFAPVVRAQDYVLRYSVLVAIVFLLMMLVGVIVLFRPLRMAASHADKMTRGELPLAPLPVFRNDEVGHLTQAFNRLLVKLRATQDELTQMAQHDTLTGLPNRALLAERMRQGLARAQRQGTRVAVLFMDLDGFKPVNDTLGHEAGDVALCEVAQRFLAVVREVDTLARVGGDEFVLLLCDLNPEDLLLPVQTVANKCLDALVKPFQFGDAEFSLGVSIGVAYADGAASPDELLSRADAAMYHAKHQGRGRVIWAADLGEVGSL